MKSKPKKGPPGGAVGNGKSALNAPHGNLPKAKTCTLRDQKEPTLKDTTLEDDDTDLNSGFGAYIRSPEAIEMMKLFVLSNSVVVILTMAWPSMKEIYKIFEEWWFYKGLYQ